MEPIPSPTGSSKPGTHPGGRDPGLPRLVLEIRTHLGPGATPEQVADEVRARGFPAVPTEDVRQVWDEGHLPPDEE